MKNGTRLRVGLSRSSARKGVDIRIGTSQTDGSGHAAHQARRSTPRGVAGDRARRSPRRRRIRRSSPGRWRTTRSSSKGAADDAERIARRGRRSVAPHVHPVQRPVAHRRLDDHRPRVAAADAVAESAASIRAIHCIVYPVAVLRQPAVTDMASALQFLGRAARSVSTRSASLRATAASARSRSLGSCAPGGDSRRRSARARSRCRAARRVSSRRDRLLLDQGAARGAATTPDHLRAADQLRVAVMTCTTVSLAVSARAPISSGPALAALVLVAGAQSNLSAQGFGFPTGPVQHARLRHRRRDRRDGSAHAGESGEHRAASVAHPVTSRSEPEFRTCRRP